VFDTATQWLQDLNLEPSTKVAIALAAIVAIAILTHLILHYVFLRLVEKLAYRSKWVWKRALFEQNLFNRIAFVFQAMLVRWQAQLWLAQESLFLSGIELAAKLWILFYLLLSLFSLLDTLLYLAHQYRVARHWPLRGVFQSIKLIASGFACILFVSIITDKSPVILLSSLGAMTAVLLLVFKDSLLGLAAGIQLSANKMLSVGDWLEMSKYGADGDVIDIGLTTVKVQNWDRTITTIPTYALISDSFKNWRGMQESGGRRIMRSIRIDVASVAFLSEEDIVRLRKTKLLTDYIERKLAEIDKANAEERADLSCPANGRRLTNLGTFRAYLNAYLKAHPGIHQAMILMVRQLEPDAHGLPIQIYAFSNDTRWVNYESIQADIFDHILAVVPEFGLRVHQMPSGQDLQALLKATGN
jgi:miniconductance mechanosensitive channel